MGFSSRCCPPTPPYPFSSPPMSFMRERGPLLSLFPSIPLCIGAGERMADSLTHTMYAVSFLLVFSRYIGVGPPSAVPCRACV